MSAVHPSTVGSAITPPAVAEPIEQTGLSLAIGGPWKFYDDFRRAHGLDQLPRAEVPEIGIAAGTMLQIPLILRNQTDRVADVVMEATLPEGWSQKEKDLTYRLSAGDVFPFQVELNVPAKKSDNVAELTFIGTSAGQTIGTLKIRVRVGAGGLPQ